MSASGVGSVEGEGEAGSPLNREAHVGLLPRILRSGPEPKSDAELTELHRCPKARSSL